MSQYKRAKWKNGKRTIEGEWMYYWPSDTFIIVLDSKDRITGMNKKVTTTNDTPEWGNWKLVREENSAH